MRAPATWGALLPVALPGLIVVGATALLVMQTPIGPQIFGGPTVFLLLSLVVGTLVVGYLVAGLQEWLATVRSNWALPPQAHLTEAEHAIELPEQALRRAGYEAESTPIRIPLGRVYALERTLAGAWGTPEGAGWDRAAFLQRIALALGLSAGLATVFIVGGLADGAIDRGLRSHGGTVLILGALTSWLVARRAVWARREAIVDILADARALVLDRGEFEEVRQVFDELGLRLTGRDAGVSVTR